jgi:hypothetical protein
MTPEDFKQLRICDLIRHRIKYVSERTGKIRTGEVRHAYLVSVMAVNYTGYSEVVQCREIKEIL